MLNNCNEKPPRKLKTVLLKIKQVSTTFGVTKQNNGNYLRAELAQLELEQTVT